MRHRASEHFGEQHARKDDVIGEASLAGAFGSGVDLAEGFADYF